MLINRDKYLDKLVDRIDNGLIKIITGIRRSGKSFLLNEIFYSYLINHGIANDHIISFAFDSAEDLSLLGEDLIEIKNKKRGVDPKKFLLYISSLILDDKKYYLLLDEVQNLDSFELVLNGYLRKNNLEIYVTGSNSKFLSSDIITEFEGKGDEIHIFPLSFSEFFSSFEGTKEEAYDEYSLYGGMPFLTHIRNFDAKSNYLTTQIKSIYIRDILHR